MDTPTDRHAGTRATTTHAGVTIAWRWCPAGTVMLGSPPEEEGRDDDEAQHPFTTPGYWLTETLITQAQYRAVMGESPSFFRGDDRPVERVSWHDARRFCEAIGARLPTEDEWEYASRAGTTGPRYGAIDDVAVWRRSYAHGTAPVRSKAPNAWGLYEPLGNVWEWTESEYPGTSRRVIRGGSWSDNVASWVRVAFRSSAAVSVRNSGVGFRCARSELPAEPAPRFGLHAAGAASRQAEVDALREVDRLKDERAAEGAALREPRLLESLERAHAREAQLTRERDEALATVELSQQTIEEQAGARRVVEREVARLIAELARARELYPIVEQELNDLRAYQAQRVADARAEGAREEREADPTIAEQITAIRMRPGVGAVRHDRNQGTVMSTDTEQPDTIPALVTDWLAGPPSYGTGLGGGSSTELANEVRWKAQLRGRAWTLRSREGDERAMALLVLIIDDLTTDR